MNRDEVKAAILKVAGNPESGIIAELADAFADEICKTNTPTETKKFNPVQETRITEVKETR
jgi:hypothetical protein